VTGSAVPVVRCLGEPRLTAGFAAFGRLDLRAHQQVHGGLRMLNCAELVALTADIQLHGRGGGGFPFASKVSAVLEAVDRRGLPPALVVNATEGEPPSWKDKVLLTRAPHLILDGAAVAARAIGAELIVVGIADDGVGQPSLLAALSERRMPASTRVVTVPHRFISGEGGALVRGINGEIPIPPGQRGRTSESGVSGLPTLLANAETFAQLALAARLGRDEFAAVGTADEPGTVLLTVGGSALRPSVVEVPLGTPMIDVLDLCAARPGPGVLVGGFHGRWISGSAARRADISRAGLAAAGGSLGAGMILPLGDATCPLGEVTRVLHYLAGQSTGQCGPCRLGLPDLARTMASLASGSGGTAATDAIRTAASAVRGRGACSHPDGTAAFAVSALETFTDEVATHLLHDGCGRHTLGILPMPATEDAGRRLAVDWTRCDGHGLCAHLVPELIRLDGNGYPALPDTPVPAWLESGARKAVAMCPALALRMTPRAAQPTR
jgi:NADH:ubiquinone oxidoreductase subunit F (NADH-binding)/ferredoxin